MHKWKKQEKKNTWKFSEWYPMWNLIPENYDYMVKDKGRTETEGIRYKHIHMCVECGVSAVCPAPSLSAFFLWHKVSLNLELGLQSTSLKSSCLCPQSAGVMSTHTFTLNFLHIFCDLNSGSYACTGSDSAHWAIPLHGIYTHFLKSVEDKHVGKKKKKKDKSKINENASYKVHRKAKARIQATFLSTCSMFYSYLYRKM